MIGIQRGGSPARYSALERRRKIREKVSRQKDFVAPEQPFVLCNGGLGDAVIGVAAAVANNNAKIIHGANGGYQPILERFFSAFGVSAEVKPGPFGADYFDFLSRHPLCRSKCHLPPRLNFRDWSNREKYENFPREIPVEALFGKYSCDEEYVVVAPKGSCDHTIAGPNGKSYRKTRKLKIEEYQELLRLYSKTKKVFVFGSAADRALYKLPKNNRCYWVTFDNIVDGLGNQTEIDIPTALSVINGCSLAVSVDTWLKTYSCVAKVPTVVIKTRYNDGYLDQVYDYSENVFLNQNIWDLKVVTIESLLNRRGRG